MNQLTIKPRQGYDKTVTEIDDSKLNEMMSNANTMNKL